MSNLYSILFHYVQPNTIHVYDILNKYNCAGRGRPAVQALFDSGTKNMRIKNTFRFAIGITTKESKTINTLTSHKTLKI